MFRRAILLQDEQAWSGIYELYNAVVCSWILCRPATVHGELEALVNEAFAKFSRNIGPERLKDFSSVGALLAYLRCCATSVLADHYRSQQAQSREEPLESIDTDGLVLDDPAYIVATQLAAQELWQIIWSEATSMEERLILCIVCAQGMSPRELQQRYPAIFPTVEDIYRMKRNVLERLRHSRELLQFLGRQSSRRLREVRHAG